MWPDGAWEGYQLPHLEWVNMHHVLNLPTYQLPGLVQCRHGCTLSWQQTQVSAVIHQEQGPTWARRTSDCSRRTVV